MYCTKGPHELLDVEAMRLKTLQGRARALRIRSLRATGPSHTSSMTGAVMKRLWSRGGCARNIGNGLRARHLTAQPT